MKKPGDKQKTICYNCSELTQSTFSRRDVSLSGTDIVAKNILVASCDVCGWVTAMPHQSAKDVRVALNDIERAEQ